MAALILENWLTGRKRHIWFSVSPDLYHDARRDLDDLLAAHGMTKSDLPVYRLRLGLGLGSGLGLGLRLGLGLGIGLRLGFGLWLGLRPAEGGGA